MRDNSPTARDESTPYQDTNPSLDPQLIGIITIKSDKINVS